MTALEQLETRVAAIRSAMETQEYDEALRLCGWIPNDDAAALARSIRQLRKLKKDATKGSAP